MQSEIIKFISKLNNTEFYRKYNHIPELIVAIQELINESSTLSHFITSKIRVEKSYNKDIVDVLVLLSYNSESKFMFEAMNLDNISILLQFSRNSILEMNGVDNPDLIKVVFLGRDLQRKNAVEYNLSNDPELEKVTEHISNLKTGAKEILLKQIERLHYI